MLHVWVRSWRRGALLAGQFSFTIVIGMGAASALVSLMLALGYQPLPYRDPGQLVAVWERAESGGRLMAISGPDLTDLADGTRTIFSSLGAFSPPRYLWLLDRSGPAKVLACYIQPSVLTDLGIRPVLGRQVRLDDLPVGGSATSPVWISDRLWRARYSGRPSVVGTTIRIAAEQTGLDQMGAQVAGVFPPGVSIPLPYTLGQTDLWYLMPPNIGARSRQSTIFFGIGRLRPGITIAQAQAALDAAAERLAQRYRFERGRIPVVQSLEGIAQEPARRTMGLLALGVGLVFIVGCANLAILMGAEGKRRQREIAIRTALGASRSRLRYEVGGEKCLLTVVSLAAGVAFAFALLRVLTVLVPAAGLGPPLGRVPRLNVAVLFGFGMLALAGALIWAALLVRAADGTEPSRCLASAGSGLGYTGASDSTRGSSYWQLVLLAAQAGVGVCLLAAATLAARTYAAASAADLGPAPRHTVVLSVGQRDNFVPTDAQVAEFNEQVLSRLQRLPGTQGIALAEPFPPSASPVSFMKEGDAGNPERQVDYPTRVTASYFRTLGIPILFGREFNDSDSTGSEAVAIISLNMARQNWRLPEQAVGSQIFFGTQDGSKQEVKDGPKQASDEKEMGNSKEQSKDKGQFKDKGQPKGRSDHYKVIGVAGDFTGYWSQEPMPTVYLPMAQAAYALGGDVILRTASPRAVAALAPQALGGIAIPATVSDVSTMEARWRATLTRPLARMAGMLMLALLGLGLSVQGVYAVTASTVAARRHELAVRAVLGALPGRLAWSVTRELALAVAVGAGLGVIAALSLRPLLALWLGHIATWRVEPIAIAVGLLVLTAAAGCYFPARAAARANPAEVLRQG